jgi:hypothetical protein
MDRGQFVNNSVANAANPSVYGYHHGEHILRVYTDQAEEEDEAEEAEERVKHMQDPSPTQTPTSNPPARPPRSLLQLAVGMF